MSSRRTILIGGAASVLVGCGPAARHYTGPEVTRVVVQKAQRRMFLMHNDTILQAFDVDLGSAPLGKKRVSGDGKTPEGTYFIDRRNPNSNYYLSLGISYPNEADIAAAKALGKDPGGDIFIHGARNPDDRRGPDWTAGCISVKNKHMRTVYGMVPLGTRIDIYP